MVAIILHQRGEAVEGQEIVGVFHHRPSGGAWVDAHFPPPMPMCFAQRRTCVVANRIYIEAWHKSLKFTCQGAVGAQSLLTSSAICSLSAVGAVGLIWSLPAVS